MPLAFERAHKAHLGACFSGGLDSIISRDPSQPLQFCGSDSGRVMKVLCRTEAVAAGQGSPPGFLVQGGPCSCCLGSSLVAHSLWDAAGVGKLRQDVASARDVQKSSLLYSEVQ